jgi:RecB family exonuclease
LNADVNKKADKHDHEQKSLHKHKQDQEQQSADEFLDTEELCLNYDDEFNFLYSLVHLNAHYELRGYFSLIKK